MPIIKGTQAPSGTFFNAAPQNKPLKRRSESADYKVSYYLPSKKPNAIKNARASKKGFRLTMTIWIESSTVVTNMTVATANLKEEFHEGLQRPGQKKAATYPYALVKEVELLNAATTTTVAMRTRESVSRGIA